MPSPSPEPRLAPLVRRGLAAGLAGIFLALPPVAATDAPRFVRRLELPVAGDAISYPQGVTADPHTGEIFVCDTRKSRILIFDRDGLFVHEITGGDIFSAPRDLAVDPEGFLFVLANHERRQAVLELDFDGLFLGELTLPGQGRTEIEPRLTSIALSPGGDRLYALDRDNQTLWITDRQGEVQKSVDLAVDVPPDKRTDVFLGKVDVYGDNVLVPVPSAGEIRLFDLAGRQLRRAGRKGTAPCSLAFPIAAALDERGELTIVDQQRMFIVRWDPRSNRCLGDHYGIGDAPGYLYYPMDLTLDPAGRILVAQGYDGRVQMYEGLPPAADSPAPQESPGSGAD